MGRGEEIYTSWYGGASGEGFKSNLDSFQWTLTHGNYKVEPQIIRPDWLSFFFTYCIHNNNNYFLY